MWSAGRAGEHAAVALGEDLHQLGFPLVRLKTGTPPRIDARTIDFSLTERQPGSRAPLYFGHYYGVPPAVPAWARERPNAVYPDPQLDGWRPQLPCYLVHTTPEMHQVIRDNLDRAPMFPGVIEGVGPRYCPSIEDKIVRFADKERHGSSSSRRAGRPTRCTCRAAIRRCRRMCSGRCCARSRRCATPRSCASAMRSSTTRWRRARSRRRWKPSACRACSWRARSTAPPATRRPRRRASSPASTPRSACGARRRSSCAVTRPTSAC